MGGKEGLGSAAEQRLNKSFRHFVPQRSKLCPLFGIEKGGKPKRKWRLQTEKQNTQNLARWEHRETSAGNEQASIVFSVKLEFAMFDANQIMETPERCCLCELLSHKYAVRCITAYWEKKWDSIS